MNFALAILTVSCLMCLWRFLKGPTRSDRFLALIMLTIIAVGFLGIMSVKTESEFLIDLAIDVMILAFVGTLAVIKFFEGKELDE
ncbi:MAG: hypothetical protein A2474_01995 [Elusimicrobia bacterium RIFOXYC2_FULL_34_12]|nr:MAG: hypothetical protein A2474_01995 [Elusimicrobia bacterium RIFOXYC2_FULL_34_12]OGS39527.1 MAG: hypothetical protein A2551_05030 [Elusimicrobia bacterium RIFOXYD2_FULL_34_30]HAM38000.1 Na(+)/H(+) antiporter subunit F [Elusimicrobiota bacterium]